MPKQTIKIKSKNITSETSIKDIHCLKCGESPDHSFNEKNNNILSLVCPCGRRITFNGLWEFNSILKPMITSRFYIEEEVEVVFKAKVLQQDGKEFTAVVPLDATETAEFYEKQALKRDRKKTSNG